MAKTLEIDLEKLTPCGWCRRCAIHDDPGGCLVVYQHEMALIADGWTPREILGHSWAGGLPVPEHVIETFEREVREGCYS